ncbi:MAG: hypothetical protein Q8K93_11725 [Reyranella sp.]|uniref:hypothetical protein n=1 Tax=Reyranella sp. TaxID=1929291 RepID=UPI00273159F7|nr:hypothetical protein [Reyranella sp.]MDP1962856.1 hypothetical protein [Reyranella sp.]MDP2378499.1 hypothetical protein [Reyranella sp.]
MALRTISVGDIFNADVPTGGTVICLALAVTATRIRARDICRQGELLDFDRHTGVAPWPRSKIGTTCTITSIAPLPPDVHEALLGLDRKYNRGRPLTTEEMKLTEAEKKAFVFVYDYHAANRI